MQNPLDDLAAAARGAQSEKRTSLPAPRVSQNKRPIPKYGIITAIALLSLFMFALGIAVGRGGFSSGFSSVSVSSTPPYAQLFKGAAGKDPESIPPPPIEVAPRAQAWVTNPHVAMRNSYRDYYFFRASVTVVKAITPVATWRNSVTGEMMYDRPIPLRVQALDSQGQVITVVNVDNDSKQEFGLPGELGVMNFALTEDTLRQVAGFRIVPAEKLNP